MRRVSYYISAEAADALDAAVNEVLATLGGLPKHAVLSALIKAAAAQSGPVAAALAEARTEELARRLEELRKPS